MIIVDRATFLALPANTVYCKYPYDSGLGEIEIKASGPKDGWNNDWITDNLATYCDPPYDNSPADMWLEAGTEIRFAVDQTVRDGMFDDDTVLFAVFDNEDIRRVIDKLTKCIK